MADSEELYSIRAPFYSGQYDQVIDRHDFDSVSAQGKQYIIRSYLALGKFDEAISLAETEAASANDAASFEVLAQYAKYAQGDKSAAAGLQSLVQNNNSSTGGALVSQIIGAVFLVKENQDYEGALNLLLQNLNLQNHDELNLEVYSLVVQLYLLLNQFNQAKLFLKKFSQLNINDSVVYNYADSLVSLLQGGQTANQHVFYFFEEISHSSKSLKNLVYLLVIHLVLNHFPESLQIIEQVDELANVGGAEAEAGAGAGAADLVNNEHYSTYLINKYKVLLINNEHESAAKLLKEEILITANQSHPFVIDYNEKQQLFDEVVAKYAKQIVN